MIISGTYNLDYNPYWINQPLEAIYLECDTSLGPVTINLFKIAKANLFWNVKIYISDDSNNASVNNITIVAAPGDTINTAGGVVLNTNKATFSLAIANEKQWIGLNSNNFVGTAYNTVEDEGNPLIQRNIINFTGQGVTASDNAGVTEVNIPIQPAYSTIQEEGVSLPQRNTIDFQGTGVTATDGGSKTIVTIPGNIPATNYGLFAQTGDSTPITNTISELTLIDGGVGTLSVPANGFSVGDSFRAEFGGYMSAKNNDKIRFRVKSGSVVLGDSGLLTMPQITNQVWLLTINFTIRSIGAAGVASIVTIGEFHILKLASGTQEGFGFNTVNNTTFNTTTPNTLDVTAQWNIADPLDSIYSDLFVLNKIY